MFWWWVKGMDDQSQKCHKHGPHITGLLTTNTSTQTHSYSKIENVEEREREMSSCDSSKGVVY